MRTKLFLAIVIGLCFAGSFLARWRMGPTPGDRAAPTRASRIVSLAPSVTETLFAVGLGDRVVGVTRFCAYPPGVASLPKVGGYHDPNFEAIVRLRPDLVVMLVEHQWLLPAFSKLGLNSLVVNHKTIDGVLESLPLLGEASGRQELEQALRIRGDMVRRLDRVRDTTAGLARPRVMFSIDRILGTGGLESVYIAGPDGFFDTMIELAGGQNAFQGKGVRFPVVSSEGILRIDPEVIIDMVSGMAHARPDEATLKADWQQLARVDAVRNGRVYVVAEPYAFVPGPRVVLLVEKLARLIHPEVSWPEVSWPEVSWPEVSWPEVSWPEVDLQP